MAFLLFSIFVLTIIAIRIPKRLSNHEMYTLSLLAIVMAQTTDLILGFKYDSFGFFSKQVEFVGVLAQISLHPLFTILILNTYPFKRGIKSKFMHIFLWTLISLTYEGLSIKYEMFYYSDWKLWYSAFWYPVIILVLLGNLWLIRNKMDV